MSVRVLTELAKNTLGEGPLWDGGRLHYIDIVNQKIHRHDFVTGQHSVIQTESKVGFAVIGEDGRVIAGVGTGEIRIYEFGKTGSELLARPSRENLNNIANDGKCDRRGHLWAGTKNVSEKAQPSGSLARYDGGEKLTEVLYPVHISNGIGWSPDNTKMYYNDSTDKIWVMDYDIKTGQASNRRDFVTRLTEDGAVPDGMTVDSRGLLYVAMWGGSRVDVYRDQNSKGKLVETISIPTALQISSVAFGGEDMKTLFVTSAAVDLSEDQKRKHPDSGRIFEVTRNDGGIRETRFRFPILVRS